MVSRERNPASESAPFCRLAGIPKSEILQGWGAACMPPLQGHDKSWVGAAYMPPPRGFHATLVGGGDICVHLRDLRSLLGRPVLNSARQCRV